MYAQAFIVSRLPLSLHPFRRVWDYAFYDFITTKKNRTIQSVADCLCNFSSGSLIV